MLKFRYRLTWSDCDYARVAYYLRYPVWVDEYFHGHLLERGYKIREHVDQGFGLPYVSTACRYTRRLTLEDEIDIEIGVADVKPKGFTVRYRITKVGDTEPAAEGEMVRRCIQQSPPKSIDMPPLLRQIIEELARN